MENNIKENVVLFDWLTATYKTDDTSDYAIWTTLLGMAQDIDWVEMDHGMNGYRQGLHFGGISVLYDGRPDMGVCVNMSGQGCRTFETYGSGDWKGLFDILQGEGFHISRLDVAFDDHSGILDINQLFFDADNCEFVSKSRYHDIRKSFKDGRPGISVYHGSDKSDVYIRIYDKAAERGLPLGQHWIRVELQLRNKRASAFAFTDKPLGEVFAGVLHNYVRYVDDPGGDKNRWRWPMKPYWEKLINGVEPIRLYVSPGVDYNMGRLDHFVFDQAGMAVATAMRIYGVRSFASMVSKRHDPRKSVKYSKLIAEADKQAAAGKQAAQKRYPLPSDSPGDIMDPEKGGTDTSGVR